MLLPDPRGVSAVRVDAAHFTNISTSSGSAGTATADGNICPIPAASE
jgi:hypothetical protein